MERGTVTGDVTRTCKWCVPHDCHFAVLNVLNTTSN